jgi:hypothetical protein
MDKALLVDYRIRDGQRLVNQLARDGFGVAAAFWLKARDDGPWHLYIASPSVRREKVGEAYRFVYAALSKLPGPGLSLSEVKLVESGDPVAREVDEFLRRYPGPNGTRLPHPVLGGMAFDEAYLYPPVLGDERWRGVSVMVFEEPHQKDAFLVEFWPHELQAPVGAGGDFRRVPRPAAVRIEGGRAVEYRPPERPLPQLSQGDYEKKALEAVEQVARKSA